MKNLKMFKSWWMFTKPNKFWYFYIFATIIIERACVVAAPVFAAKVITSLTAANYNLAILFLTLGFAILVFRYFIMHLNYLAYTKLLQDPYMRLQSELANKIFTAKNTNLKSMSKSNLINIIHGDVWTICNTLDVTTYRIGDLLQVIMIIITIFIFNVYVGLAVMAVCIVNYFVLDKINNRMATGTKRMREALDVEYESFSHLYDLKDNTDGSTYEQTKNILKKQFEQSGRKYIKVRQWHTFNESLLNNWFVVFYSAVVFAITIFLITLLTSGSLQLEMYLIIVPYLLTGIEASNGFMDMFREVKDANVSMNRIQKILQFADKPVLEFGKVQSDFDRAGIDFMGVSAYHSSAHQIKDVDLHIRANQITLIHGQANSGKRALFYCLTRDILPKKGKVLINGLSTKDYSNASYQKQLNAVISKPQFLPGSIMKNLKLVERSDKKIYEVCNHIGLHARILAMPHKYDTAVETLTPELKYLIDLARVLLLKSEIMLFYEIPDMLDDYEKENIKKQILKVKERKTLVIFSYSLNLADICDKVVEIKDSRVESVSFVDKSK